jgi:hypothetical protein
LDGQAAPPLTLTRTRAAKGRERGYSYERGYGYDQPRRRASREFKEEYDDGRCKVERKLEKSGEYKEEVKCRSGYRSSYRY